MSHQLTESVKILQKCAIWSGDRFLLLQRAADAHSRPGKWDLPGGNAEWPAATNEDIRDPHRADIVREIAEETGIVIAAEDFRQPVFVSSYFDLDKQVYTVILGWSYQLQQPQDPELSTEHTAFVWVEQSELERYDFGFAGGKTGFLSKIIAAAEHERA